MNEERMTLILAMLAKEMGIEPSAMLVAGRECPMGYELSILVIRDESEDESEMRTKVERLFSNGE